MSSIDVETDEAEDECQKACLEKILEKRKRLERESVKKIRSGRDLCAPRVVCPWQPNKSGSQTNNNDNCVATPQNNNNNAKQTPLQNENLKKSQTIPPQEQQTNTPDPRMSKQQQPSAVQFPPDMNVTFHSECLNMLLAGQNAGSRTGAPGGPQGGNEVVSQMDNTNEQVNKDTKLEVIEPIPPFEDCLCSERLSQGNAMKNGKQNGLDQSGGDGGTNECVACGASLEPQNLCVGCGAVLEPHDENGGPKSENQGEGNGGEQDQCCCNQDVSQHVHPGDGENKTAPKQNGGNGNRKSTTIRLSGGGSPTPDQCICGKQTETNGDKSGGGNPCGGEDKPKKKKCSGKNKSAGQSNEETKSAANGCSGGDKPPGNGSNGADKPKEKKKCSKKKKEQDQNGGCCGGNGSNGADKPKENECCPGNGSNEGEKPKKKCSKKKKEQDQNGGCCGGNGSNGADKPKENECCPGNGSNGGEKPKKKCSKKKKEQDQNGGCCGGNGSNGADKPKENECCPGNGSNGGEKPKKKCIKKKKEQDQNGGCCGEDKPADQGSKPEKIGTNGEASCCAEEKPKKKCKKKKLEQPDPANTPQLVNPCCFSLAKDASKGNVESQANGDATESDCPVHGEQTQRKSQVAQGNGGVCKSCGSPTNGSPEQSAPPPPAESENKCCPVHGSQQNGDASKQNECCPEQNDEEDCEEDGADDEDCEGEEDEEDCEEGENEEDCEEGENEEDCEEEENEEDCEEGEGEDEEDCEGDEENTEDACPQETNPCCPVHGTEATENQAAIPPADTNEPKDQRPSQIGNQISLQHTCGKQSTTGRQRKCSFVLPEACSGVAGTNMPQAAGEAGTQIAENDPGAVLSGGMRVSKSGGPGRDMSASAAENNVRPKQENNGVPEVLDRVASAAGKTESQGQERQSRASAGGAKTPCKKKEGPPPKQPTSCVDETKKK